MNTATAAPATIKLTAALDSRTGEPTLYKFSAEVPTVEDARAFAALFPKSHKVHGTSLTTYAEGGSVVTGLVNHESYISPNKANGGVNETAVKRYRAIVKKLAALGVEIVYSKAYLNSYETREAFEAAIGL